MASPATVIWLAGGGVAPPGVLSAPSEDAFGRSARRMLRKALAAGADRLLVLVDAESREPASQVGVVGDHINASGRNPLLGPNDEEAGPRFPDMTTAYDREWTKALADVFGVAPCIAVELPPGAGGLEDALAIPGGNCLVRGLVAPVITARHMGISTAALLRFDAGMSWARVVDRVRA